ncbi:caspase family protein [Methylobacterium brachiatum]|uniref:caspase family protein n=1 Tax=Methylobacterium brachiatum TaxID=269660 RepID=UPI0008EA450A|nr:caspase family protein [Methylobacterium brachiatum]SFJ38585.1 Caspase domain-containing protein [Methylobacterium brachiatum]
MTAWAFVVGIDQYPPDSKLRTLRGAVADAAAFADWVADPQGGAVAPENLYFWTCPAPTAPQSAVDLAKKPTPWPLTIVDFTRPPTTQDICRGIFMVAVNARNAGATRLYVFLAGHGFQTMQLGYEEPPQNCFVAGNFDPRVAADGLVPCDDMARMLKVAGPPEIVIFIDACREDARLSVARPAPPWNRLADPGHNQVLCVGRAAQERMVAYEVPHGNPSRGAFSMLLVNALSGHRVGGRLTARDLEDFIGGAIGALVAPLEQYPDIDERPRPRKLVLAQGERSVALPDVVIQIVAQPNEGLMLIGGERNARIPISNQIGTTRIQLEPGAYILETASGAQVCAFAHFGPGATHVQI